MVFANSITSVNGINSVVKGLNCRDGSGTVCGGNSAPWGACNGSNPYDQNSTGTGYRCVDQLGSGTSNVVSCSSPPCSPSSTPTPVSWVGNILQPVYQWSNSINGSLNETGGIGQLSANVVLNRDIYRAIIPSSNFNGTSGVGVGLVANRPATCTANVGYWATDQGSWNNSSNGFGQGQFYQCTATNTWSPYYVPYPYPHPLTLNAAAPNPPTSLQVTVQ